MNCLPRKQLSKSQRRATQLQIEPETNVMQGHFRSQASLKPGHLMRAFASQAERVEQFVVDSFNNLPQTGEPAAQGFGPPLLAPLMRWGNYLRVIALLPLESRLITCKPLLGHVRPVGRRTRTGQTGRRRVTKRKQGGRQMLIVGTGTSKAKAGNDPLLGDTQQEMEAFIPADAMTPANIGLPRQPAQATPFGITRHGSGAIE